MKSPTNNWR